MKIDIITLHTVNNYGSVLQTYATQQIFRKLGFETEVIDYWRENNLPEYRAKQILSENYLLKKVKPLITKAPVLENIVEHAIRYKIASSESPMSRFIKENVDLTKERYISFQQLKDNPPLADIYVTGSDQVWNSTWNGGIDIAYYLAFVPENKREKKISFAASIGKTSISNHEKNIIKPLLKQYSDISVRENSAVKTLKSMGINSQLILDPTLMLEGKDWEKLDNKPAMIKEPYLLIYQLNENDRMDTYTEKIAKKMNLKIIRFGFGRSDRSKLGHCVMKPSIAEFINLISHAKLVITDSFHATAFSLNLGTNLISVRPPRFSTRLESVLELTQTKDRLLNDYQDFSLGERSINNQQVQAILNDERKKGLNWLKNAIKKAEEK